MKRSVHLNYQDPLDQIWFASAEKMGLRVSRSSESYASYDGRGTLTLSSHDEFDSDDCVAQMVFHEICHSMVQGPQSFGWVDWGLDNETNVDDVQEHACLRLQAALLTPLGLRQVLAPTTDFRVYYDALPADPFRERQHSEREAIVRARAAWNRRNQRPWRNHLAKALEATASILETTKPFESLPTKQPLLSSVLQARQPMHPAGLPLALGGSAGKDGADCGRCAWSFEGGRGKKVLRCRQSTNVRVKATDPPCERYEAQFDCLSCGACCREAYDTVEVSSRDPATKHHLSLMVERSGGFDMKRKSNRCVCLQGGLELTAPRCSIDGGNASASDGAKVAPLAMPGGAPFTCAIYEDRPRTCREFTLFSENCLDARRKVGLSR